MMVCTLKFNTVSGQSTIENFELIPPVTSLDHASQRLPGGAYTTLRTYRHDQILGFDDQINRLVDSTRSQGMDFNLDENKLREVLRILVDRFPVAQDVRVRITLDTEQQPGMIYFSGEPLRVPSQEAYELGVAVVTCDLRRQSPEAKLTSFIAPASQMRQALPPGIEEALMVDSNGYILEGLSSNFFAVEGNQLFTAEKGILAGITRKLVLEVVLQAGIEVNLQPVQLSQTRSIQEAFITSASRGILPVRSIDGWMIGDGFPGKITLNLSAELDCQIRSKLVPI